MVCHCCGCESVVGVGPYACNGSGSGSGKGASPKESSKPVSPKLSAPVADEWGGGHDWLSGNAQRGREGTGNNERLSEWFSTNAPAKAGGEGKLKHRHLSAFSPVMRPACPATFGDWESTIGNVRDWVWTPSTSDTADN